MSIVHSNSKYLRVTPVPPLEGAGWVVKVRDYRDFTTLSTVVTDPVALTVGPELCAVGAGSITLNLNSPFWKTKLTNGASAADLRDREYLWEAYEDGILRFDWLGSTVDETLVEESGARSVTISGPGTAEVLKWGIVLRPGYPAPIPKKLDVDTAVTSDDRKPSFGWEFPVKWSAMRIWSALYLAARRRKVLPWVVCLFSRYTDSSGRKWEYVPTVSTMVGEGYRPTPGTNLLDLLDECTGQDFDKYFASRAEWFMNPGFRLEVHQTAYDTKYARGGIGSNKEKQIIFYEAQVQFKQRVRSRQAIANHVVVIDANGSESVASDATSAARWRRREQLQNKHGNLTDAARRIRISKLHLAQSKDEEVQWVIQVPANLPGRRPFYNYNIGDWIGVNLSTDGASRTDAYRILAIVVQVTDEETTVELTLQSTMEFRQQVLNDQITTIVNKPNNTAAGGVRRPRGNPSTKPRIVVRNPDGSAGERDLPEPGPTVWIQPNDPGSAAKYGDFWVDTDYVPPPPPFVPAPQPEPETQPEAVIVDEYDGSATESQWSYDDDFGKRVDTTPVTVGTTWRGGSGTF